VTTGDRGRRPLTRLATAGAAGHVFFELAAGVGMPFASFLGPGPAAGLWAGYTAGVWRTAANRPSSADRALAVVNAISRRGDCPLLGVAAAHPLRASLAGGLRGTGT
jgi:hypothetical protein